MRAGVKASIPDVLDLPCVPMTAIDARAAAISELSAVERCTTGMPRCRASRISGLSSPTAWVNTTAVASDGTCPEACPVRTATSRRASSFSPSDGRASLPDTANPRSMHTRATGSMPAPPMPTKCTRLRSTDPAVDTSGLILGTAVSVMKQPPPRRPQPPQLALSAYALEGARKPSRSALQTVYDLPCCEHIRNTITRLTLVTSAWAARREGTELRARPGSLRGWMEQQRDGPSHQRPSPGTRTSQCCR